MADETKQIMVLMGPYRDNRLTVSAADADAAINAHWAVDPFYMPAPDEEPHPPLSDEERTAALEAATTWAKAQWDTAQGVTPPEPPPEPPIEGRKAEKRDMKPDATSGRYGTRDTGPANVEHDPRRPKA